MLLCDNQIRDLCRETEERRRWLEANYTTPPHFVPLIEPFSEAVSGNGVISYGLTSAGYDLRLADEILVFKNTSGLGIDPKRFHDLEYRKAIFDTVAPLRDSRTGDRFFWLPAHSYVLGRGMEYLRIPRHLKARCVGKSTNARAAILINATPAEPGWEGHLTIEIGNVSPLPARIYVGEGIAQLEFETLSAPPEVDYAQKGGIYQNQTGVTAARVKS